MIDLGWHEWTCRRSHHALQIGRQSVKALATHILLGAHHRMISFPVFCGLVWDVPFCAASSTLCLHPPIAGEMRHGLISNQAL